MTLRLRERDGDFSSDNISSLMTMEWNPQTLDAAGGAGVATVEQIILKMDHTEGKGLVWRRSFVWQRWWWWQLCCWMAISMRDFGQTWRHQGCKWKRFWHWKMETTTVIEEEWNQTSSFQVTDGMWWCRMTYCFLICDYEILQSPFCFTVRIQFAYHSFHLYYLGFVFPLFLEWHNSTVMSANHIPLNTP